MTLSFETNDKSQNQKTLLFHIFLKNIFRFLKKLMFIIFHVNFTRQVLTVKSQFIFAQNFLHAVYCTFANSLKCVFSWCCSIQQMFITETILVVSSKCFLSTDSIYNKRNCPPGLVIHESLTVWADNGFEAVPIKINFDLLKKTF